MMPQCIYIMQLNDYQDVNGKQSKFTFSLEISFPFSLFHFHTLTISLSLTHRIFKDQNYDLVKISLHYIYLIYTKYLVIIPIKCNSLIGAV